MDELDPVLQKDIKAFILANLDADVSGLLLNPPKEVKSHIRSIAEQILARQKAKNKLPEWATHPDLIFPPPLSVEQASSERTAAYKSELITGDHLVDLTGGMGIDTLAFVKVFNRVTYVEQDKNLANIFAHNSKLLGRDIEVVHDEAAAFLERQKFENVTFYLDPARRDTDKNKVFRLEDCSPNLIDLFELIKKSSNQVLVKLSPILDISSIQQSLGGIKEIHVVSVKNECKELLVLIDFSDREEPKVKTINLDATNQHFDFYPSEEKASRATFDVPKRYLYEPNASILKSGAFKVVGEQFRLKKLHQHTHLYTSDQLVTNWPGRVFEVLAPFKNDLLSTYAPNKKINVITRNYVMNAQSLKKKYKLEDGGDYFLIGFKDATDQHKMVIAKKEVSR